MDGWPPVQLQVTAEELEKARAANRSHMGSASNVGSHVGDGEGRNVVGFMVGGTEGSTEGCIDGCIDGRKVDGLLDG